jgi:hypothetical protein
MKTKGHWPKGKRRGSTLPLRAPTIARLAQLIERGAFLKIGLQEEYGSLIARCGAGSTTRISRCPRTCNDCAACLDLMNDAERPDEK